MPPDLIDLELESAARACRAMAYQDGERAKAMENPDMRRPIEATAEQFAKLAEKLEAARLTRSGCIKALNLADSRRRRLPLQRRL
jgi:hypothetical protein